MIPKQADTAANPTLPRKHPLPILVLRALFQLLGVISPRLAARWAHYLWFRPQRYTPPAREHSVLSQANCHPITHGDKQISVYSWGSGPAVLLVHGWSGRGTQLGEFVAPLQAAGFRVVSFDAPAHGRSAGRDTTLPEISEVILALARQHGPFRAVVTHSFGAPCTLFALAQKRFTERMVAISAPATLQGLMDKFSLGLALTPATVARLRDKLVQRFGDDMWERFSTQSLAARVALAALVIHDRDDRDVSWHEGEAIARAWHARFVRTEGLGHRRILRDGAVVKQVVQFVQAKDSTSSPKRALYAGDVAAAPS
jgi:pimeloyl-ACP methyl ester carboxylesterase